MSQQPKPTGPPALTGAERQARYRARHATAPVIRYRRPTDRRSRLRRWVDAVAELVALQAEYAVWFEALPEPVQNSSTDEALQAIVDLDFDELIAIQPARGFGRDQRRAVMNPPSSPAAPSLRKRGHPKIRRQSRISDRLTTRG